MTTWCLQQPSALAFHLKYSRLSTPRCLPCRPLRSCRLLRKLQYRSEMLRVESMAKGRMQKAELWWEKDQDLWVGCSSAVALQEALHCAEYEIVFVDWYATWCHGCRKTSPILSEIAADTHFSKKVKFVRACVDSMSDFARKQGVKALPYITIYDNKGQKLIGFGAAASKAKTFRKNIEIVLENPGMDYRLDPNGYIISLMKVEAKSRVDEQQAAIDELRSFSASLSQKLNQNEKEADHEGVVFDKNRYSRNSVLDSRQDGKDVVSLGRQKRDLIEERQKFLDEYGGLYGYNGILHSIYETELGRRLGPDQHYLDYTGSSLYTQTQLEAVMREFRENVFGNPHSENPSSSLTRDKIEEVRRIVLDFFDADPKEYQVIFTKSTTAALKMLAETYPWSEDSTFKYLRENHNSVLGMREYVLKEGGDFESMAEDKVEEWISTPSESSTNQRTPTYHLFAFPAEENFAGVKYPLSWVQKIQQKSNEKEIWKVVVDAAAFVGTQPLSLREFPADYVAISFYKMFGYPTGLGALIVKVDAIDILEKVFWAGGSVALATSSDDFHVLKCRPTERLEDGTVAFLDIISLKHGFDALERLGGIRRIQQHVRSLTEWLYKRLTSMKHSNGLPMVKVFGKHGREDSSKVQGGILNFELLGANGKVLSYKSFELEASKAGFHIRTGIECNPGAAYNYIGIHESEVESLAGLTEGCDDEMEYIQVPRSREFSLFTSVDSSELANLQLDEESDDEVSDSRMVNVPLGSVRVSLGHMSTFEDCLKFTKFLERSCKDQEIDTSPK